MGESRLAVITCGLLRARADHPDIASFVDRAPAVFSAAGASDGYCGEVPEDLNVWPPRFAAAEYWMRCAITLTFWRDVDTVAAFAFNGPHVSALRDRRQWFLAGDWPTHAAWWFDSASPPTQLDASARYDLLDRNGPSPDAFDLRHAFDATGIPVPVRRPR